MTAALISARAFGCALAVCLTTAFSCTTAHALDTVRFASWGPKNVDHADFFVADELGFFKDEGLAVEWITAQGNGDTLRNVVAGNADIAETDPSSIGFALDRGLKVKAFYDLMPQNQFTIVARKSGGIKAIPDLKGKKVAVVSMASGSRYNVMTLLNAHGLKESDVTLIATGPNFAGPLGQGQVDAIGSWEVANWDITHRAMRDASADLVTFPAKDVLNVPTNVLATTDELLQSKRDILIRYLRAQRRGTEYMHAYPEKAAEIAAKYVTGATADPERNLAIVKLKISQQVDGETKAHGFGWFNKSIMDDFADKYHSWGLLKKKYSFDDLATNDLLESFK